MKDLFKLRHLDTLSQSDGSKVNFSKLMVDVLDYKNSFFGKSKHFVNSFLKIGELVSEVRGMDLSKISLQDNLSISIPTSIGEVSYLQMLNLQSSLNDGKNSGDIGIYISKIISIATYCNNSKGNYDPTSKDYISYEDSNLDLPLLEAMGIYNWIISSVAENVKSWDDRFFSVEVIDDDLQRHGGNGLSQFNVINTIKALCNDFCTPEKDVWNFSYEMVMTNNYSKAYSYWVQKNIQVYKEAEIDRNRRNKY